MRLRGVSGNTVGQRGNTVLRDELWHDRAAVSTGASPSEISGACRLRRWSRTPPRAIQRADESGARRFRVAHHRTAMRAVAPARPNSRDAQFTRAAWNAFAQQAPCGCPGVCAEGPTGKGTRTFADHQGSGIRVQGDPFPDPRSPIPDPTHPTPCSGWVRKRIIGVEKGKDVSFTRTKFLAGDDRPGWSAGFRAGRFHGSARPESLAESRVRSPDYPPFQTPHLRHRSVPTNGPDKPVTAFTSWRRFT